MGEAARALQPERADPAGWFRDTAPDMLDLAALVEGFAGALAAEGVAGHLLCARAPNGALVPLFGDRDDLARDPAAIALSLASADGEPVAMLVAAAPGFARARVHALAGHAVACGMPLLDAGPVDLVDPAPSAAERLCLAGLLAGESQLDLADRLDTTPGAVAVHLRRARYRLGAASPAEAVAIAMRRGFISEG